MCTPERTTSRAKTSRIHVICAQYCSLMFAVSTCGPIGYPASPPPLSSQNIQSQGKSPTSRRAQGETQTISLAQDANPGGRERVKVKGSRIQSIRIGSALVCVRRNVQHRELNLPDRVHVIYARCYCDGCCAHQWAHRLPINSKYSSPVCMCVCACIY